MNLIVLASAGRYATITIQPAEKDAYDKAQMADDAHLIHTALKECLPLQTYMELSTLFAKDAL